jgi:hypothetical protein
MKIIELLIDELDKLTGVDAVALVEDPAIEANFFAFKSESQDIEESILLNLIKFNIQEHTSNKSFAEVKEDTTKRQFAVVEEQQMIVGPLMIPEKLIMRVDEEGEPYFVYFSKDTIQKIAQKVMKDNHLHNLNIEHNEDDTVDGYMVSTWLIEDEIMDKQQVYGFSYPKGTWMGQYKIEDLSVWNKVKEGEIKGFSIEGFFSDRFVQAKAQ